MDRNRLPLFIALSAAILIAFQFILPHHPAKPPAPAQTAALSQPGKLGASAPGPTMGAAAPAPRNAPRVTIDAARLKGSLSLLGARIDDIDLRDYHETVSKTSPLVRLLEPAGDAHPGFVQLGWSAADGTKVPDEDTLWKSAGGDLSSDHPLALTWDNGQGQAFEIDLAVDKNYAFAARQIVHNNGQKPVAVLPWQRARRDYTPPPSGYGSVFQGLMGAFSGRTHQMGYADLRKAALAGDGTSYTADSAGGWTGIVDKYWLTALIPDQQGSFHTTWFYSHDDAADHYQSSSQPVTVQTVQPGQSADYDSHIFIGAKEVGLLHRYETQLPAPLLSYSVDWGRLYFISQPIFSAIDFVFSLVGNFGIAILVFTLFVKILFYPLASKSYESMGKMRLLAPKVQAARERFKDDPAKQQQAMMEVYKQEGINPAAQLGGCLPMMLQIPVFIALYTVLLVTIEMRHAPFYGWIHDLSATDPTNVFNLFGLLPFDPSTISPQLHLGLLPLVLGVTMYFQQKLNPPPPDPVQARMFQFMPLIFMFLMGQAPAGLVIYWCWNNLLTMAQQWWIQRHATLKKAKA
jgi:YidC/Oxa1 family membrane protein insertase